MKVKLQQTYLGQDTLTVGLPHDYPGQQVTRIQVSAVPVNSYGLADNLIAQFGSPISLKANITLYPPPKGDLSQLKPLVDLLDFEPPEVMAGLLQRHLSEEGHQVRRVRGILANGTPHVWLEVWQQGHWLTLDPWAYHQLFREPGALLSLNAAPPYQRYLGGHEGRRLALSFGEIETAAAQTRIRRIPLPGALSYVRAVAFVALGLAAVGYPPQGPLVLALYGLYLSLLAVRQGKGWLELLKHNPARAFEPLFFHGFALSLLSVPNAGLGLGFLGLWAYFRWPRRPPRPAHQTGLAHQVPNDPRRTYSEVDDR